MQVCFASTDRCTRVFECGMLQMALVSQLNYLLRAHLCASPTDAAEPLTAIHALLCLHTKLHGVRLWL